MKSEYGFSNARRKPYASKRKKQVTIRLDEETIAYFKDLAEETGIKHQTLTDLYLRDCALSKKRVSLKWRTSA